MKLHTAILKQSVLLAWVLLKDAAKDTTSLGFGVKDVVKDAPSLGFA